MSIAICAIFKNEAPYLREWIEFHRIVGVGHFHLYQNRSEDDWQAILRPYIEDGIVEVTDWPMESPCQLQAYQHFIERHKGQHQWVAFIDCDEFLFSPCRTTISEALDGLSSPDWGAVGVNWMCFGASGHEEQTEGLVVERFTLRPSDNFTPNCHIKSVVRMDRVESVSWNPHHFEIAGGTFSESGQEVVGPHSPWPSHSWLRINHYLTKSRQEYLQRIARGRADMTVQRPPSQFDLYQSDEVHDTSIWRFLPALKQRLQSPLTTPSR
jgi:Glycosyltransferase family 92